MPSIDSRRSKQAMTLEKTIAALRHECANINAAIASLEKLSAGPTPKPHSSSTTSGGSDGLHKRRGRPPGSKNKAKTSHDEE